MKRGLAILDRGNSQSFWKRRSKTHDKEDYNT